MEEIRFKSIITMLNWKPSHGIRWVSREKSITHSIYILDKASVANQYEVLIRYIPKEKESKTLSVTTTFDEAIKIIASNFTYFPTGTHNDEC